MSAAVTNVDMTNDSATKLGADPKVAPMDLRNFPSPKSCSPSSIKTKTKS